SGAMSTCQRQPLDFTRFARQFGASACVIPLVLMLVGIPAALSSQTSNGPVRPRTIVTTDPELDDSNSMVRFLLYTNEITTEGLVDASSQYHWRGDGKGTRFSKPNREYSRGGLTLCPCTSWRWNPVVHHIDEAVDIYAKAYPNLKVHDPNYPTPESLKSKIR